MSELIDKIGPLFWVLCAFSAYALAILAERLLYLHRIQINAGDFLCGITKSVRAGKINEAYHEASALPGPMARVVETVLKHADLPREELRGIAQDAAQLEVFHVEKHLRGLLVVATASPLVGMLGTMMGLMQFYAQPGILNGASPTITMSDAIFQALLSSAMGLCVAIPVYLFYCYLSAKIRQVIFGIERVGVESVNIVCDAKRRDAVVVSEEISLDDQFLED